MDQRLRDVDLYSVYQKWRQGSGPFRCFFRATNFVSLKHYTDFPLEEVGVDEDEFIPPISKIVGQYDFKKTLFMIELSGIEAIRVAYFLNSEKGIKPVLSFNGLLHPYGLVGDKEYISGLLTFGEKLQKIDARGYAFILDHNRFGEFSDDELRRNFNNQYELSDEDLPPLRMLKDLGFEKLVYIHSKESKEDVENYLVHLQENDFPVIMESIH